MKPFMTIRVGAIDVQAFRMPLEDDTFGDFSYINTRIRIDDRLEGATLVDTLLHEINHVVWAVGQDRKSTRLNSSHGYISYAVFCLKKKKKVRNNWT